MIASNLLDPQPATDSPGPNNASGDAALRLCADVSSLIANETSAHGLLQGLVRAIGKHSNSAAACCWLLDHQSSLLRPVGRVGCQLPFDGLNEPVPMGQTVIGEVAANRTSFVVDDLQQTSDLDVRNWAKRENILSFACLPIETSERLYGVVAVFQHRPFEESWLFALSTVRQLVAAEIERRHSGNESQRSNEFLNSFVHSAPAAVIGLDRQQAVTHWNQEAERIFGWTRADVVGRRYTIVPADGREMFDEFFRSVQGGQRLKPIETIRQHADGSLIPVQTAMSPIYNERNDIVGVIEILTDVTRQKYAERCLRTQLAVSSLIAASETVVDAATRTIRAVCENLGWKCGELWLQQGDQAEFERAAADALPNAGCERFLSTISQSDAQPGHGIIGRIAAAGNTVWRAEISQLSDTPRAAFARMDGLHAAIGVPIGDGVSRRGVLAFFGERIDEPDSSLRELMLNIARQLEQFIERQEAQTALRTAEDHLRQSQKMDAIGLLAGGVAHDFNNILSVIIAYSELGLDEIEEENSLFEPLTEIQNAGQRAASLTRQLLAFSRKQVFQPTDVDLNQLSENMDRMLRRLVGANITCESNFSKPLYRLKADAAQLEQVLLNLVVNARDAMPDGGRIQIATRNADLDARSMPPRVAAEPGSFAVLSVTDTGCGMDEATQARIFEPFFTTKAPGKGTGMGLSTVYGIVHQSGGFITVDSAVGKGTTFSVYLPRLKESLATKQVDVEVGDLPAGSGTILVAENDDTVRVVVRRILELRGYRVLEARHGGEAIDMLRREADAIQLIVTDIMMPVMDGIALSRRVQQDYPGKKLLFVSGYADLAREGDAAAIGGTNFLQKPFTSDALVRKVHAVLTK